MSKSATALVLVLAFVVAFPVVTAIGATFFSILIGLFATMMGVIGGVFGTFFSVAGGILGSSWVPMLIVAVIIAALLSRRR
ncbi:MAG: hypothetical protein DIU61_000180 [Bacteroidota bacterium]|jgi:hypothetical protein|nr:MAG: hypothetical protein DIU61_03375 [Bacteroidota bacterium]